MGTIEGRAFSALPRSRPPLRSTTTGGGTISGRAGALGSAEFGRRGIGPLARRLRSRIRPLRRLICRLGRLECLIRCRLGPLCITLACAGTHQQGYRNNHERAISLQNRRAHVFPSSRLIAHST